MTDHYDEMRVPPDPSLAEALRQRLYARMAVASRDDHEGRSHLHLDTARLEPLQRLVTTEEINMTVDPNTSESRNRRRLVMAAAAVVAVIGVAGIALSINNSSEDDDEAPSPAEAPTVAPPTVAPTTVAPTTVAPTTVAPTTVAPTTVAPRTQTGAFAGGDGAPVTVNVPDGWTMFDGWLVHNFVDTGVAFLDVRNIYADGCQWVLVDPPVGPTVDDLVSAYANLPGFAATDAVDVTVDGYVGKQIEFTVPDYNADECRENHFGLWQENGPQAVSTGPSFWAQTDPSTAGTNQHNQLWILDVGGTRLVIDAYSFPNTSPQDRAALDEILASIQIG